MITKNKKSMIFPFGLGLVLLMTLLRIFFLVNSRLGDLSGEFSIGDNQLKIYSAIQKGEQAIIYNEQAFSLALQQILYDTAENGGYETYSRCGTYKGYKLWRTNDTECYPDFQELKNRVGKLTAEKMKNDYLANNPYVDSKNSIMPDYEIKLEQEGTRTTARAYALSHVFERIICKYGKPPLLVFDWAGITIPELFSEEREGSCGLYAYTPSLRKELNFKINDYKEAVEQAEALSESVERCMEEHSAEYCIENSIKSYPSLEKDCGQNSISDGEHFVICYNTRQKLMIYDRQEDRLDLSTSKIKFALSFS